MMQLMMQLSDLLYCPDERGMNKGDHQMSTDNVNILLSKRKVCWSWFLYLTCWWLVKLLKQQTTFGRKSNAFNAHLWNGSCLDMMWPLCIVKPGYTNSQTAKLIGTIDLRVQMFVYGGSMWTIQHTIGNKANYYNPILDAEATTGDWCIIHRYWILWRLIIYFVYVSVRCGEESKSHMIRF